MLQLINSISQTADLYPDTIIPIERNNPLFNEDNQPFADITYGFKLPRSPNNLEFIKNAHLVEAATKEYAQEATLLVDGTALHAGILTYKITGNDIDALLKINFGTIAKKIKTVKLSEIYTGDAWLLPYFVEDMKAACQYPKDYPYSFFPVYNDAWSGVDTEPVKIINDWDHATQTFNSNRKVTCPYFKLKYLLQKAVECMGFQLDGDWLKDPESDEIFVYTQINSKTLLNGSFTYMPQDLTVHDFFVRIKERFGISCNFDMITGKVIVVTPKLALDTSQVQNISDYVTSIEEVSVPEPKGYSIVLKPDEGDKLFLDPRAENEDTYVPTSRLIIGDQEKPIEMESSTLKVISFETYSMPATKQLLYPHTNRHKPFPLRFLRYKGLKDIGAGKVFPQAEPIELNADDALFYKFRNESKPVKIKINIPAFLLARLKVHQCIAFLSKEGTYTIALPEKISYNLSSGNTSYITATIQCRAMVTSYANDVQLIDFKPELENDTDDAGLIPTTYKAFFDQNRIPFVDIEIYTKSNRVNGLPSVRKERIQYSTDKFGTGGMVISPPLVTAPNWELRVLTATPVYAIVGGIKFNFTQAGAYWVLNMITLPRFPYDPQGVWIIFDDSLISTGEPVTPPPPTTGGGGTVTPPVDPPTEPPAESPTTLREAGFPLGLMTKSGTLNNAKNLNILVPEPVGISMENDFKNTVESFDPVTGAYTTDFSETDNQIIWAKANGKKVHVHAGHWPNHTKAWVNELENNPAMTTQRWWDLLKIFMQAPLLHHKNNPALDGVIDSYDAFNELFRDSAEINSTGQRFKEDVFLRRLGPDYIKQGLIWAKEADPRIKVFVNEYGFEYGSYKVEAMIAFASECKAEGIPLDGWGLQYHQNCKISSTPTSATRKNLKLLADTVDHIHLSEVALSLRYSPFLTDGQPFVLTPEMELLQAEKYLALMRYFVLDIPKSKQYRFTLWGIIDPDYLGNSEEEFALLWNASYQRKLGYDYMLNDMIQINSQQELPL